MNGLFKKNILRLFSLLCCGAILCSGCSKSPLDPKKPVSLELWHYYNGPQKTAFDALVDEFNETVGQEQGITIEAFNQGTVNELLEKVIDSAEKKVGAPEIPDIFAAYADNAYQMDQMGLVASLDPYLTKEELAEYKPEYIEEGRFDAEKNLKIFPIAKSTEIFLLNETDWTPFAADTGATLEQLSTIEGITSIAEQYYNWTAAQSPDGKTGEAFFGRDAMANYYIIGSLQLGEEILQVENGKVTLNLDEAVFRKLWDHYYIPYVKGYFNAEGKFRSDDVKVGNLIALVGSVSGSAYFPDKVSISDEVSYPIDMISLPAPHFQDGEHYAVQQGAGMVVTKSTKEKEYAASVFLKWFTETERNVTFSVTSGYLPVKIAANDPAVLQKAFDEIPEGTLSENLKAALLTAVQMTKTETLYTNKAFEGGTPVRQILENSMTGQAQSDRTQFQALLEQGKTMEEASAEFFTDEKYHSWFQKFSEEMRQAAK